MNKTGADRAPTSFSVRAVGHGWYAARAVSRGFGVNARSAPQSGRRRRREHYVGAQPTKTA